MESGKNESFVANRGDIETAWVFKAFSDAGPSGNVEESLSLCEQLFAAFDGLVFPTRLEYVLWVAGTDSDEKVPIADEIESVGGITSDELVAEFQSHEGSEGGTFRRLTIDGTRTRIDLVDGEHLIDLTSDRYRSWTDDGIGDQPPAEDPFKIEVFYNEGPGDAPNYYQIVVRTYTDIWFEDTEVGERNRKRLATALDSLYGRIDAKSAELDSRFISERALKRRGFSILLPWEGER